MKKEDVKEIVREGYGNIARQKGSGSCCGCSCSKGVEQQIAKQIGYNDEELKVAGNMGLGCGNPVALGKIKEGDVVVDLGSGGGFDCFLASRKAGTKGKVIGIDFTEEMIEIARKNASKQGFKNVEFVLGDIEELPLEEGIADVVISNCVINLASDKEKVFREANRVLKEDGKMYVSDIVLLEELSREKRENKHLLTGCVAGALLKEEYIAIAERAGFSVKILGEDKKISKEQYNGIPLESLKLELSKVLKSDRIISDKDAEEMHETTKKLRKESWERKAVKF